jgi:hypothetical protein
MRERPDTSENAPSRTCARTTASMGPRARRAGFSARVARHKREQTPDGRVHARPRRVGRRRGTDPTTLGRPADACIRDAASARARRGHARLGRPAGAEAETSASRQRHASALLARCSRLTRRADARDHRVLPAIRATTHVEGKAISRRAGLRSAPPPGDVSAGAPAMAGLVDQRRRERRLIQKAPADSATRTPIHPAKRSSEDRCIASGSSIDDEGTPDGTWSHRRREPQRTSKSANRPSPARTSPLAP